MSIINVIESQFSDDDNNNKNNLKPERYLVATYHEHPNDVSFFQICQSCFWCSSTLYATRMTKICPVCTSEGIDSMPISPNEAYTYDVGKTGGLELSFRLLNSRR
jgi:hypothetical protein